jgi:hypothetical protein
LIAVTLGEKEISSISAVAIANKQNEAILTMAKLEAKRELI